MTQIASIVYKPEGLPVPENDFLRVDLDQAQLIAGYGIEGDRKGGHPDRQLNLMSYETLTNLRVQGFYTEPGQMGEQIVVHQMDVDNLVAGARLKLGAEAIIEVVGPRNGCQRFSQIQGKPLDKVKGMMGVMARVVQGGLIRIGDPVRLMPD